MQSAAGRGSKARVAAVRLTPASRCLSDWTPRYSKRVCRARSFPDYSPSPLHQLQTLFVLSIVSNISRIGELGRQGTVNCSADSFNIRVFWLDSSLCNEPFLCLIVSLVFARSTPCSQHLEG